MLFREYNLGKLWQESSKVPPRLEKKGFADVYIADKRARFKDWFDDQLRIKQWKQIMDSRLPSHSHKSIDQLSPSESAQTAGKSMVPSKTLTVMNSEAHNISQFSDKPAIKSSSSFMAEPRNNLKRRVMPLILSPLKASYSIEAIEDQSALTSGRDSLLKMRLMQ